MALALIMGTPLDEITSESLEGTMMARSGFLGPFSPSFKPDVWIREKLEKRLPENAHEIVSKDACYRILSDLLCYPKEIS